jgi:hypothetical protein
MFFYFLAPIATAVQVIGFVLSRVLDFKGARYLASTGGCASNLAAAIIFFLLHQKLRRRRVAIFSIVHLCAGFGVLGLIAFQDENELLMVSFPPPTNVMY